MGNLQAYREEEVPFVFIVEWLDDGARFLHAGGGLGYPSPKSARAEFANIPTIARVRYCRDPRTGRFV